MGESKVFYPVAFIGGVVQKKEKAHRFETVWAFPKGGCAMFEVSHGNDDSSIPHERYSAYLFGFFQPDYNNRSVIFLFESISYLDTHNTTSPSI